MGVKIALLLPIVITDLASRLATPTFAHTKLPTLFWPFARRARTTSTPGNSFCAIRVYISSSSSLSSIVIYRVLQFIFDFDFDQSDRDFGVFRLCGACLSILFLCGLEAK